MDYQQTDDKLVITIDEDEQAVLRELEDLRDSFTNEDFWDFIEPLIANSDLQSISPSDTGDLTDAPMLGILGDVSTKNEGPYGAVKTGHWDFTDQYQPILHRWAFMDYQVRSPLEDLLDNRQVTFVAS